VSVTFPCYLHVARTSQQARSRWRPYFENYVEFASMVRSAGARSFAFDELTRGPAICGSPAEAVDRLGSIAEQLGLSRLLVLLDAGGIPTGIVDEVIDLVGAEVIPALRRP
jgi:alkanesulfonate monooxygenase SsuD/methylene tetrahydromethanopterin reductase-like flavin-dependent oxidoreductase (luciferase family)